MTFMLTRLSTLKVLALLGVASISLPAQAVNVSTDGLGQVLIYPYYTVRGGHDSFVSVVNRTDQAKVVQVRLRESRNGREVHAVKVFLGAHDQWTAGITATDDGAKLFTGDQSCTSPAIPAGGVPLSNARFASTTVTPGLVQEGGDGAGRELDRTREGYIEVIELGVLSHPATLATLDLSACSQVLLSADMGAQAGNKALSAPSGGLLGSGTLINVAGGMQYSYRPVVLDAFANVNLWSVDGPDLRAATPKVSLVLDQGRSISSTWPKGEDAVSAVLTHATLLNDFVRELATDSGTDWVVTMPTKHYYVPVATEGVRPPVQPPFGVAFTQYGACDLVDTNKRILAVNREGKAEYVDGEGFPQPRPVVFPLLCWETTVMSFADPGILGSLGEDGIDPSWENGWARYAFGKPYQKLTSLEGHVYRGLPVTGFMVHNFVNGDVNGLQSNYGGNFDHKYTTVIDLP
ncbi:MAG: hypothetical protein ABWY06_23065 [Pseudomonas sp.]|uniref:hypothetical protein n=1 Tax=Pseudomonas sp. TaxID=306 RepID=UPI0033938D11